MKRMMAWALAGLLAAGTTVFGEMIGGVSESRQVTSVRLGAGALMDVSGTVEETFRAYYEATGRHEDQKTAEKYDLDDFGVDAPYASFALQLSHQWRYAALRWNVQYLNVSSDATAKRDYYISLFDDVEYRGNSYERMKIPKGSDFSMDLTGAYMDLVLSITPFTIGEPDAIELTPVLDIGLVAAGGKLDIDAGRARGTYTYQNPPVDFVVGGDSSSMVGVAAPMVGGGLELCVGAPDRVRWLSRGTVDYFAYDGSSKPFSSAREKDIDVSFLTVAAETGLEVPLQQARTLSLGVRFQMMNLEGDIKSHEREKSRIIAAHERFDKSIDFDISMLMAYIGLKF